MNSYQQLEKRYTKKSFLDEAAKRREALNYNSISFQNVKDSAEKKNILRLLPQAHANFYEGHDQACIAMCGILIETMLRYVINSEFKSNGCVEFTDFGKVKEIRDLQDVENFSFAQMISCAKAERFLSRDLFFDLCNIKKIRNITVHDKMPFFKYNKDDKVFYLPVSPKGQMAFLPYDEGKVFVQEIWALTPFYVLTKTREILAMLLEVIA